MKLGQHLDGDQVSPSQWIELQGRNTKIRGNLACQSMHFSTEPRLKDYTVWPTRASKGFPEVSFLSKNEITQPIYVAGIKGNMTKSENR